jgi:hypothetical protein
MGAGRVCASGACGVPTHYAVNTAPTDVAFIDACAAPGAMTMILPNADDADVPLTLPFAVRYWDVDHAAGSPIYITSNGYVTMTTATSSTSPPGIDTVSVHGGDDQNGPMGMCVATLGTAPNRKLVVEWVHGHYCCGTMPSVDLTYEVIFDESPNRIEMAFSTMTGVRSATTSLASPTFPVSSISGCPDGGTDCAPSSGYVVSFDPIP